MRIFSDRIHYKLDYSDLSGGDTCCAHIHFAQQHVSGGVSAFLCGGGDKPACTPTNGHFEGDIDAADVVGPDAQGIAPGELDELAAAIRAGATYANVHTTPTYPEGEIRGQLGHGKGRSRQALAAPIALIRRARSRPGLFVFLGSGRLDADR